VISVDPIADVRAGGL